MKVSQTGFSEIQQRVRDRTLGMRAVCVLMEMLANMGWDNRVEVSQKELCAVLGMRASEVSEASRALLDAGFVTRLANRRGWYRISPRLAWKGSGPSHRRALAELTRPDARGDMNARLAEYGLEDEAA